MQMSETKFAHARGEKSHLKKNINQQKKERNEIEKKTQHSTQTLTKTFKKVKTLQQMNFNRIFLRISENKRLHLRSIYHKIEIIVKPKHH